MKTLLNSQMLLAIAAAVAGALLSVIGPRAVRALPAGQLAGGIGRAWRFVASNPRSSIAGAAALIASFSPKYAMQITGLATGIGLLMTSDADAASANKDQHP